MKKSKTGYLVFLKRLTDTHFFKVMRVTVFLILIGVSSVFASLTYSQATKFTLNLRNVPLEQLFEEIQSQSEFNIFYKNSQVDKSRIIDITVSNASVEDILTQALEGLQLDFNIIDRQIVIFPEKSLNNERKTKDQVKEQPQKKEIYGKITDSSGQLLPGVTIIVKGTTIGTVTDNNGQFTLEIPKDAQLLQISFVGMKTQEIEIAGKSSINIAMEEDAVGIEEIVAVGYGLQKKLNVTGSVASVKGDQLTEAPQANVSNTLAGKLPGLISHQTSGQPGKDAALLSIRGFGNALIIVDGVEGDINTLDPNSIETINILKDGAASIYGARAGNGVILVTTKRGNNDKPVISLNTSFSGQSITVMPKKVSSGQYAELLSEEWLQSGKDPSTVPYTKEDIQNYYNEIDPYLYPNTDWYDVLIRDWAPQQQHNFSVRGGSGKIKYYALVGVTDQESMWKKNGGKYSRYNVQSNIDAKITDELDLQFDLSSSYEDGEYPYLTQSYADGSTWQYYWGTLPIYPSELPDKSKIPYGGGNGGAHITTNGDLIGYNNSFIHNLKGTLGFNYNLKWIPGLSAKAVFNYNQTYSSGKIFLKPVEFFTYDPESDLYTTQGTIGGSKPNLTENRGRSRTVTGQLSLNYKKIFAKNHEIEVLMLSEFIDYSNDIITAFRENYLSSAIPYLYAGSTVGMSNNGFASEMGRKSYVGRMNYSFMGKYLFEAITRYDASAKFQEDKRWGLFPSFSIGWRLSEESFLKNANILDNLKLRASYGESGYDAVGNFQYLSGYALDKSYILGNDPQRGIVSTGIANSDLTWEKMTIYDVGADIALWQNKLYGEFDIFYRERDGIPAIRLTTLPSTFGAELPQENINSTNDRGFEAKIGSSGKDGDFAYDISANISYSRAKWNHFEEPEYEDKDQARIYKNSGQWTDRGFGYLSDGLFTSQEEIDNLDFDQDQQGNITLNPGDIKYIDLNNDGVLDWRDQTNIGKGDRPHWMFGSYMSMKYKNVDLALQFTGAWGYHTWIKLHPYTVNAYDNRWTEENNNPNALVPRYGGASTNDFTSDFYYKPVSYVRLKTINLGYNLPSDLLEKINFRNVRVYVSGTNLLTFSSLDKYSTDPEAPSGASGSYYPQQRTVSVGLNISF